MDLAGFKKWRQLSFFFNRERLVEDSSRKLRNTSLQVVTSVEKTGKENIWLQVCMTLTDTAERRQSEVWFFCQRNLEYYAAAFMRIIRFLHIQEQIPGILGKDIVPTIKGKIEGLCVQALTESWQVLCCTQPIQANTSFVDDKKVSDHHAIIPTEQFVQLEHMTNEETEDL